MSNRVFVIGDRVAYSRAFLQSIGAYSGWSPFARGNITALNTMSNAYVLTTIATIWWDKGPNGSPFEGKVNLANLVHAERIHLEAV